MISVYLDWGVISELRQGKYPELAEILFQKDKFLISYSSAHIGDLLKGQKYDVKNQFINADLDFLSKLTNNRYFNIDKQGFFLDNVDPRSFYDHRTAPENEFANLSSDAIKEFLDELDNPNNSLSKIMDSFKKIPLNNEGFKKKLNWSREDDDFYDLFPDLRHNPTFDGLIRSVLQLLYKLNEGDDYSKLRKLVQKGFQINRDRMFAEKNPFKVIDKAHKNLSFDSKEHFNSGNYLTPKWYDDLCHDYLMLDMHGFQEDKIQIKKGRKQTMKNTNEDAYHSAFASTCNFYIIKDIKAFEKTKKVYEKLGMSTIPLSPEEFIIYSNKFLKKRNLEEEFALVFQYLKSDPHRIKEKEDGTSLHSYFINYYLFDFFNNVHGIVNKEGELKRIILCQAWPKNKSTLFPIEIETLLNKFFHYFGKDIHGKEKPEIDNLIEIEWRDIEWKSETATFLLTSNLNSLELHCYIS